MKLSLDISTITDCGPKSPGRHIEPNKTIPADKAPAYHKYPSRKALTILHPSLAFTRNSSSLPLRAWRRALSRRGNNSQATSTRTAILKLRHTDGHRSNMNTHRKNKGVPNAPVKKTKTNPVTTSPPKNTSKPVDALPLNKAALMTSSFRFTWWRGRGEGEQQQKSFVRTSNQITRRLHVTVENAVTVTVTTGWFLLERAHRQNALEISEIKIWSYQYSIKTFCTNLKSHHKT